MQLLILEGGIGQSDDASGEGKDFEVMAYHPGPWEREREEALHLSMQPESAWRGDSHAAHPLFAPLAWIACLLAGAVFWVAVFRVFF